MKKNHSFLDTVDQIVSDGVNRGILHLSNEDEKLVGNKLTLKGNEVVNFGSCSYLGLEFDPRLIEGACTAIRNYGTQFSESRAYVSIALYKTLETKFEQLFGSPVIVTPTTSLGHIACIPVVVSESDAVIIDHQVHSSVQNAIQIVKAKGVYTELMRHNRMDLLEERIIALRSKYEKIWYMADGIYSMYGDACPVDDIMALLEKYPELHFYVDDAHGMSCFGKNGRGYVLNKTKIHPRMIVATSLAKAFATGGAVLIFPDRETARKVRTCGGPLITSGPLQPGTLGAANASADIHLSNEITSMQEELQDKIRYAQLILKKYGMPVISNAHSPVFFIAVSLPKIGYKMIQKMLDSGYYLNLGIFPAVPMKNTGIRFTITRLHTFTQIDQMVAQLSEHFQETLEEENFTIDEIYKAFKMARPSDTKTPEWKPQQSELSVEIKTTIQDINQNDWDDAMAESGSFDYSGMQFLEKSFTHHTLPENNWKFFYLMIRDQEQKVVLSTFFTSTLWKEDMLSSHEVSALLEQKRLLDPYLHTSTVLMSGSLFTEGQHLYVDYRSEQWREALKVFFKVTSDLQEKCEASSVMIRDFKSGNEELDKIFIDEGFFKLQMPDNHQKELPVSADPDTLWNQLSPRSKKHMRQDILKHADKYIFTVERNATEEDIRHWYELYLNVKNRSFELNTFTLPFKMFKEMAQHPQWQISTLRLKPGVDPKDKHQPVAVMFTYLSGGNANFMLIGIDYDYQKEFHCYRQALYQVITYNHAIGMKKVHLGFAASFEKRKLGADIIPTCGYMQLKDNYSMQVLSEINATSEQLVLV